ncbi:MAG: 3-alpha,7-alpha,12-alpha-trihydroxy-5-beta-cholest-24-enoyl-CoA hydratase [Gammaproteobacteria bacterium]|nr:3-alpha,7-alpha,12-alpha-trihydroxy-5-beta-cholest-24-enoyl-CoA hydratase [Gammaproteobacteria bacterium]
MNLEAIMNFRFPVLEHTYTQADTMLYGLGLSLGQDPSDAEQLSYVYEDRLQVLPSMCNVLAHPGFWLREPALAVDWVNALHGEQRFVIHRPLPSQGTIRGVMRVLGVEDKGPDRGALLFYEKVLTDQATSEKLCTVQTTGFLRGDGGCGSAGVKLSALEAAPNRAPDATLNWPTARQAALIYRLCGDRNPIHADPVIAAKAGFEGPILHGLCTMGMACFGLVKLFGCGRSDLLRSMSVRFAGAIYPGETLRIAGWHTGGVVQFCAHVVERGDIVLDRGVATIGG